MPTDKMPLSQFYVSSAGRCPAYNVNLNLPLSRYCPLAVECWKLTQGDYLGLPFDCANYRINEQEELKKSPRDRRSRCPLEDRMIELALIEAENKK